MRLLVSVSSGAEAEAALAGGADIIDAKDPTKGALGAVSPGALRQISTVVNHRRLVTAALGDADEESALERTARVYAAAGAALVKVGFAGIGDVARATSLLRAAIQGVQAGTGSACGVIAVAYADADRVASLAPALVTEAAIEAGTVGVLVDTADKLGPGLRALWSPAALAAWVSRAHDAGLLVAVAGKLGAEDLMFAREAGAHVAGVRGAACDGGRAGLVTAARVRTLRDWLEPSATLVAASQARALSSPGIERRRPAVPA